MGDPPGPEPAEAPDHGRPDHDPAQHDPAGLDLAQAMVKSVGARRTRRPRPAPSAADPRVSGARADDRDPKRLADAFEQLVDSKGWSTELNVHTVLVRWSSLVGPVNAQHAWPESYTAGVLVVRAESTVWATSLRGMASQLVARLNAEIGEGSVTRVQVLGPDGPSWKHGRRSVRDGRGPRDTYG